MSGQPQPMRSGCWPSGPRSRALYGRENERQQRWHASVAVQGRRHRTGGAIGALRDVNARLIIYCLQRDYPGWSECAWLSGATSCHSVANRERADQHGVLAAIGHKVVIRACQAVWDAVDGASNMRKGRVQHWRSVL